MTVCEFEVFVGSQRLLGGGGFEHWIWSKWLVACIAKFIAGDVIQSIN